MRHACTAALLLAPALLAALLVALFPLQADTTLRRAALRLAGVRRVRLAGLNAYEKDTCTPGQPCRCIALIHGLGDSALTWDEIFLGRKGAERPPLGTRLVAVELPGTEGSQPPAQASGYAVSAQARAVRDALQIRCPQWTVAGNSLGGWVAAWLALQWPEGVRRLVLVDPAGLDDRSGLALETASTLSEPTAAKMKEFAKRAYDHPRAAPPRAWQEVAATIRERPVRQTVAALRFEDLLEKDAGCLRMPVVILWGQSDGVLPRAMGERLHALIRGSRFELIPACGHLPQQECPAAVTRALYSSDL